jgi:hypothetical protein
VIQVPERFRPQINVAYPEGNKPIFEEWFNCDDDRYLKIHWTSFWVNNGYSKNRKAKVDLQTFINSLESKQYFTIIQYDDGPVINLPSNVKVFGMSGPRIDFPIPLICQPHKYSFDVERDIFASFVGRVTHPIRREMLKLLSGKAGMFTTSNIIPTADYCKVMARSVFTLCPRGYGQSSFRICEALQYGSIPVYISDQFIFPYNEDFNEYGVIIHSNQVDKIDRILSEITPEDIKRKQEAGKKIYTEKFSFEGVKRVILDNI